MNRPEPAPPGRRWAAAPLRLLVFLIPLWLPACAAALQPMGRPVTEPSLAGDALIAVDGHRLPLRSWLPEEGSVRAVILALHGFNDYSRAFDDAARHWADRGIATYAYDQRGFGASARPGVWPGTPTLVADARQAAALIRARHRGVAFHLLGESMGGAVAIALLTGPDPPPVASAILVAPAIWGRDGMTVFERIGLWWAVTFVPGLTLTGQGLDIQVSDNIEMLRGLGRDPLVIKATRADAIDGLVDLMTIASNRLPGLPVRSLILFGDREEVIPLGTVDRALDRLPPGHTVAFYPQGYHLLLRDLNRRLVQDDIAAWIARPGEALPSAADRGARARLGQAASR